MQISLAARSRPRCRAKGSETDLMTMRLKRNTGTP